MSNEQMKVLDMLSENKISVDEATQLLDTINQQAGAQSNTTSPYYNDEPSFIGWLKDIFKSWTLDDNFQSSMIEDQL